MDVAASEFYSDKDQTYDLNFKEEVLVKSVCLSINEFLNLIVVFFFFIAE